MLAETEEGPQNFQANAISLGGASGRGGRALRRIFLRTYHVTSSLLPLPFYFPCFALSLAGLSCVYVRVCLRPSPVSLCVPEHVLGPPKEQVLHRDRPLMRSRDAASAAACAGPPPSCHGRRQGGASESKTNRRTNMQHTGPCFVFATCDTSFHVHSPRMHIHMPAWRRQQQL